jgi:serine protease AprX
MVRALLCCGPMRCTAALRTGRRKATPGARLALLWLCTLVLVALPVAAAPPGKGAPPSEKLDVLLQQLASTPGESDVIIQFADDRDAANIVRDFGQPGRKLGILKALTARIPNHALRRLAADRRVTRVSFDRPASTLNARTAITSGARTVHQISGYTGAGIGVAVIDSGVTGWHEDLAELQTYTFSYPVYSYSLDPLSGEWVLVEDYSMDYTFTYFVGSRVTHFADFVNGYNYYPYDGFGHGTHVAGIVAGSGYHSNGDRAGMAPDASIIALKALDDFGRGTISSIIAAIDYAITVKDLYNVRVINLSVGAGVYESYETDPLTVAARRAVEAGIVVVAAAGNLGKAADGLPQYGAITAPANAPWVLTVGASSTEGTIDRSDDVIAPYSSRGPTMYDYSAKPDLVAPGTGTVSLSDPFGRLYVEKPNLLLPGALEYSWFMPYMSLSGTSMAAPAISGTVALMLQANPNLTPNLVKAILQFTAEVRPSYNWITQGAGFLNARGAVQLAEYFAAAQHGSSYPDMTGWSKHVFWGNHRVRGGVLTPGGTAWGTEVRWGAGRTPANVPIVWGENCIDGSCDNIVWGNNVVWGNAADDNIVWGNSDGDNVVWGNSDSDNVVWGNSDVDNIVWGNAADDNIVWGNDCGGADCDNVVWGNTGDDNVVWGNCAGDGCDNVVWGNSDGDNVVWGNTSDDNIVWGNCAGDSCDNVVWGNSVDNIVFGVEGPDVSVFDAGVWDSLFRASALTPSDGTY